MTIMYANEPFHDDQGLLDKILDRSKGREVSTQQIGQICS